MIRQPDFGGVRVKVERAKEHLEDLYALSRDFHRGDPYEIVPHVDPETGDVVYHAWINEQPPLRWSAVIGDAVHNLRSSLDLMVCEVVRSAGEPVGEQTGFPVFKSAEAFESGHKIKVKGAPDEAVDHIKAAKPYKGGNDAFWTLHRLDIADKHRLLIAVAGVSRAAVYDNRETIRALEADELPAFSAPLLFEGETVFPNEDGAEVFRLPPHRGSTEMHVQPQFSFTVAFAESDVAQGEAVIETLYQLTEFVEGFVSTFLTLFGQR